MTYVVSRVNALVSVLCIVFTIMYGVATTIKISQKILNSNKDSCKNNNKYAEIIEKKGTWNPIHLPYFHSLLIFPFWSNQVKYVIDQ